MRAYPDYSSEGEPVRVGGISVDLTELAETRAALAQARATSQALIDASPRPMALLRRDGAGRFPVEWINRRLADLLGKPIAEIVGRPLPIPRVAGAVRETNVELTVKRADGPVELLLTLTPVDCGPCATAEILVSAVDRTALRLAVRGKAERQAMEALGRMTGHIAHEVNNALQPIMSNASLAMQICGPDCRAAPHHKAIRDNVRTAREIVRSVLALRGGAGVPRQSRALEAEVAAAMRLIAITIPDRIGLEIRLGPPGGDVALATAEVFQILNNLVINAIDAIEATGTITVETGSSPAEMAAEPAARPCAFLAVTDSGCGMDAETLRRAREPYFTTKPCGKGTGLGLAMVQTLVGEMGGSLDIASSPGRGTVVKIWLPLCGEPAR